MNKKKSIFEKVRKNIGFAIAIVVTFVLGMILYGNIFEINQVEYWAGVWNNITSISFKTIIISILLFIIRQGLSEQALIVGINTPSTIKVYKEHGVINKRILPKRPALFYYLQEYNKRRTEEERLAYINSLNYGTEQEFLEKAKKSQISKYYKIKIEYNVNKMNWSTIESERDKNGQPLTLAEHKLKRSTKGLLWSLVGMACISFIVFDLVFENFTWGQFGNSTAQLIVYLAMILAFSIFPAISEYEYGKFTVPKNINEINFILMEFEQWKIPEYVQINVIDKYKTNDNNLISLNVNNEEKEVNYGAKKQETEDTTDRGTDIQEEQEESETL